MFWAYEDKNKTLELRKRNLFIAKFSNTSKFNWDGENNEKEISFLVKKLNLPSLNIPFERLHGNQFVHYFHVGEVNWEPITMTFVDVLPNKNSENTIPNWKKMFYNYLTKNLITEKNRTSMLDLATFCEEITISNYATYINQTTFKDETKKVLEDRELGITGYQNGPNKGGKAVSDNRENVAEDFIIKRPKITKIDFGSIDYGSDEAGEINITFLPEWCEYKENSDGDEQAQKIARDEQAKKEAEQKSNMSGQQMFNNIGY